MNKEDKQLVGALKFIAETAGDNVSWYQIINALEYDNVIDQNTHSRWFDLCNETEKELTLS